MKKGQKIRIIESGQVGTIVDSTFFVLKGRQQVMYQVEVPGQKGEACWFPAGKLGKTTEKCHVLIKDDVGRESTMEVLMDYEAKNFDCELVIDKAPIVSAMRHLVKALVVGLETICNAKFSITNE